MTETIGELRASIIIPAFNAEHCLKKAVDSAVTQTECAIEVIIIDDCSTDGTWAVANACAEHDARIRIFKMERNYGKSHAMNFATSQARGQWIAVLDADDWYAPERIECLVAAAEAARVDMITDNQVFIDVKADGQVGTAFSQKGDNIMLDLERFLAGSDSAAQFDYGMLKPVFRAGFLRDNRIEYYPPARRGQDFYVLLECFSAGAKGLVLRAPYYYYVQPFGQTSGQWAQHARMQYSFSLMQQINDAYISRYKDVLSSGNLTVLYRRGRCFMALSSFHAIRECVRKKQFAGAISHLGDAPSCIWSMLARRAMRRLLRLQGWHRWACRAQE